MDPLPPPTIRIQPPTLVLSPDFDHPPNMDHHPPGHCCVTGAGFASGQNCANMSRYQAAESLSMNGRALNDRAIEVSPSSSRVSSLSRASLEKFR